MVEFSQGDGFYMLKLIVILGFLSFMAYLIMRIFSPVRPSSNKPVELKACEFCGTLVRVDKAVKVQGRLFCSLDHANRMR